jgi:hypothetical protein
MRNILKASVVAVALATSVNALASGPGLYVGGQLGYAQFPNADAHTRNFAAGANAGYSFAIAPKLMIGPELAIDYLGTPATHNQGHGGTFGSTAYGYSAFGVVNYNAAQKIDVFAKAGATRQSFTADIAGASLSGLSSIAPIFAVGAGYDISRYTQVYLQYNHTVGGRTDTIPAQTLNAIYAGIKYNFGTAKHA